MTAQQHEPPLVVCIMGPTASGKSLLAMEIAKLLAVEIISVDSAQVYRGMDLGTAKPSTEERGRVPHHLIDIIGPEERYSAARFSHEALNAIHGVTARARLPLLVGGTMLYFKALREGLSRLPAADAEVRALIDNEARERGWAALHAELRQADPVTAARLKPSDSQRIQRALEILRLTGIPASQLMNQATDPKPSLNSINIALLPAERALLHQRIALRFEAMLQAGLVEELRVLRENIALTPDLPSMRCVGYRQAWRYLDGEISKAELRDLGVYATRQLAKRQITWLRSTPQDQTFDMIGESNAAAMARTIAARIAEKRLLSLTG